MSGFFGGNGGGGGGGRETFPGDCSKSVSIDSHYDITGAGPSVPFQSSMSCLLDRAAQLVFKEEFQQHRNPDSLGSSRSLFCDPAEASNIQALASRSLQNTMRSHRSNTVWATDGRLPKDPTKVLFNSKNYVGNFTFSSNRLGLNSQDNFSTIRANTCVYQGKWQYELMLGTKGVMQVGWATSNCQFSAEKGVGDTPDSYAYDGNRQRKWNVATYKYGAMWQCGDIISCTIDLDEGIVEFYRNGKSLGPAFDDIKTGPDMAYFPAVSLALGESLTVNFGATPFRYPQLGFSPLESPPMDDKVKADRCVKWLTRLVQLYSDRSKMETLRRIGGDAHRSRDHVTSLFIIAQHIATHLGPLLTKPYIVEACLVPVLAEITEVTSSQFQVQKATASGIKRAHILFDLLMASLEHHELLKCLESLIICLLTGHKQASEDIYFRGQKFNLRLLYVLLSHERLRKFCLGHILFDKVRFPSFVNIKIVDEEGLVAVVKKVWWSSKDGEFTEGDKQAYDSACDTVRNAVEEVEQIQVDILRLLLNAKDAAIYQDSSRALFLAKFRIFLKEHAPGSRVPAVGFTPLPVILCLFHRLLTIFNELWMAENLCCEVTIPPRLFYDGSLNYFDTHRLGGLESHLQKTLTKELAKHLPRQYGETSKVISKIDNATAGTSAMVDVDMGLSEPSCSGAVLGEPLVSRKPTVSTDVHHVSVTSGDMEDKIGSHTQDKLIHDSLLHLVDGIVMLYHIGAHKQLGKIAAQRDSMIDNITHVMEIDKKIQYCTEKGSHPSQLHELNASRMVFISKLEEQARQQAWVVAAVHSSKKHMQLIDLMKIILTTLKEASKEGELFGFVPDFYVESLTEMCTSLRLYFTEPPEKVPGCKSLLSNVGEFLALHFCDSRIVYADSKDSLIQALAGFVCHQTTLNALQDMPEESRIQMVRNLLQPYENRAWAQNNWILVRFWKGCGFGFRYTKSPHMTNKFGPKPAHSDNPNFTQATAPCPSTIFQGHVVEVLKSSPDVATAFLNSLLNQLNWAFSEFIGMLQEIQNASNRPERVFIDSRQLRICATCFDLALALLRVLEMIVNIAPELFTDISRQNAEHLLGRLCLLLCQVLHRVSGPSGCFGHVVGLEIPGLETIHHYPILTAVTGILVTLVKPDFDEVNPKNQVATRVLLNEPSFQLSSVYHLLGGQDSLKASSVASGIGVLPQPSTSSGEHSGSVYRDGQVDLNSLLPPLVIGSNLSSSNNNSNSKFSLRNYPENVNCEEISLVERFIMHLETCLEGQGDQTPGEDDDSLCTICYAYPAAAIFEPCTHTSCRACVTQHLMNRSDCFFCKATIKIVRDQNNDAIIFEASVDKTLESNPK